MTWPTPATISQGTALSSAQLDANAGVPGSFIYSPVADTVPTAGTVPILEASGLTVYRDWQNNVNTLPTGLTVDQMPVLLENHDL